MNGNEEFAMRGLKDVSKMTDTEKEIELGIDAQRRANNCLVDIKNTLNKWKCTIDPVIQISGQGIARSYAVIPLVERPMG